MDDLFIDNRENKGDIFTNTSRAIFIANISIFTYIRENKGPGDCFLAGAAFTTSGGIGRGNRLTSWAATLTTGAAHGCKNRGGRCRIGSVCIAVLVTSAGRW